MRITFITNPHICNLDCDICFSKQAPLDWEPVREMDFEIVERVVKAFLPLGLKEIIPSTIGEPFLYSHFEDFLKLAKKHNIKVNITTNGTFPNGGIKKWMPLLLPVLSDIKFSAMHGKIPSTVSEFIREKNDEVTVSIQATLGENDKLGEVPVGVDRVKINKPYCLNQKYVYNRHLLKRAMYGHLDYSGNLQNFENFQNECRFLGLEAWVWVDGSFQVCPNPDARFGLRTRFPFGDFGNFATEDPVEVWNGRKYRDFCESYMENAICRNCRMRRLF